MRNTSSEHIGTSTQISFFADSKEMYCVWHEDASLKIRRESAPTINLELFFKRPCNGISIHERATWHLSVTI
jgi:hypothetical protein